MPCTAGEGPQATMALTGEMPGGMMVLRPFPLGHGE